MEISAEKIIERYAQELANAQQQLFVAQAMVAAYQAAEEAEDAYKAND